MRVGAILSIEEEVVKILGYGEYSEDSIPDECAGGMGPILRRACVSNPKIVLDDGNIVFGCECWWGEEEAVKRRLASCKEVIQVDINQYRKENAVVAIEE
jgi:hypothetical protein